ncbi:MAG: hypothetical protein H6747_09410 [Deltaproteobacteria bacterium]|nr:hypothetical protein [Deltaproteobacteria bacterium]
MSNLPSGCGLATILLLTGLVAGCGTSSSPKVVFSAGGGDASVDASPDTSDVAVDKCETNLDCAAPEGWCDREEGRCVACLLDHHCGAKKTCVARTCYDERLCKSDKECADIGGVCDKVAGRCGDCVSDADCTGLRSCVLAHCLAPSVPCSSSKQCLGLGGVCDKDLGICVECASQSDCAAGLSCVSTYCVP